MYEKYFDLLNKEEKEINNNFCKLCNNRLILDNYDSVLVCENCGYTIENFNDNVDENDLWRFHKTHLIKKDYKYYFRDDILIKRVNNSSLTEELKYKIINLYNLNSSNIKEEYRKANKNNLNYNFLIIKFLELLKEDKPYIKEFKKNNSKSTKNKNNKIFNKINVKFF